MAPAPSLLKRVPAATAKKIVDAEARVAKLEAELSEAKAERKKLRDRHGSRFPLGEWLVGAGHLIRRREQSTGERFSLSEYLKKHKLTKAMAPFVSQSGTYDVWDVKPAK